MLEINICFQRPAFSLNASRIINAPITGISGASGSGKSTLLAVIAGLLKPQSGHISLNNRILLDSEKKIFVPAHQRRIGLVFQDGQLLPHLSVKGNLLYGLNNRAVTERQFDTTMVADVLEITHLLDRRPNSLSGGEKQRVALGRAVLYSPELLLLDEPLSALDEQLKQQILPFLLRIKSEFGIHMIYVTHAVGEIQYLTDNHLTMKNGLLVSNHN